MTGWVRLWHDMPTDPKWRSIARKSGQPLVCVIALFNLLMVNAGNNDSERGRLSNWDNEDAASALDMEPESVAAIISAMQGKVLDGECLTGWEKRQPKREDGTAAQRKAAWQARQQNTKERSGTQGNAPEADPEPDSDSEPKEDTASAASSARAPDFDWIDIERQCCEAAASDTLGSFVPVRELIESRSADIEGVILPTLRARRGKSVVSWRYYLPVLAEALLKAAPASKSQGPPKVFIARDSPEWVERVAAGHKPGLSKYYPAHKAEGWMFDPPADQWNERRAS